MDPEEAGVEARGAESDQGTYTDTEAGDRLVGGRRLQVIGRRLRLNNVDIRTADTVQRRVLG